MSNYGIPNMSIYGYSPPEKAGVPLNALILWYGVASAVPTGWTIYSTAANNFIMGASAAAKTTTPAGGATHIHTNTSPTGSGGSHGHGASNPTAGGGSSQQAFGSGTNVASSGHTHSTSNSVSTSGSAHTHTIGDVDAGSSMPSYHRLYWIERTA